MNYLVVSIHDAAPPYLGQLKEITAWLDQYSIRPRCIKVVPNFLDRWNILEHRDFLDWLLEEKEKGHEIIQHGYTHLSAEKQRELINYLRDRFITNNESEFLHRDYEKAKMALEEGRKILNGAGVICYGFTSPTWFQSQEAVQAIEDFGFRYFTTHSAIFDCEKQKRHSSMAMGFQRKKYIAYR